MKTFGQLPMGVWFVSKGWDLPRRKVHMGSGPRPAAVYSPLNGGQVSYMDDEVEIVEVVDNPKEYFRQRGYEFSFGA